MLIAECHQQLRARRFAEFFLLAPEHQAPRRTRRRCMRISPNITGSLIRFGSAERPGSERRFAYVSFAHHAVSLGESRNSIERRRFQAKTMTVGIMASCALPRAACISQKEPQLGIVGQQTLRRAAAQNPPQPRDFHLSELVLQPARAVHFRCSNPSLTILSEAELCSSTALRLLWSAPRGRRRDPLYTSALGQQAAERDVSEGKEAAFRGSPGGGNHSVTIDRFALVALWI